MAFRACWMGSGPALVRMGPRCTWSFCVHGPHQCEVYTMTPHCVKQCANRGEPLSPNLIWLKHIPWHLLWPQHEDRLQTWLQPASYWFMMTVFTHPARFEQYGLQEPLLWLLCFCACTVQLPLKDRWTIFYCDRKANHHILQILIKTAKILKRSSVFHVMHLQRAPESGDRKGEGVSLKKQLCFLLLYSDLLSCLS